MKLLSKLLLPVAKIIPRGYWRILRYAANRDSTLWDYSLKLSIDNNLIIRADLRESVFTGIFRQGNIPHQRGLDVVFSKLIKDGETVFDVGANIGYTALVLSRCVGLNGKVIAIEPSTKTFELLRRSLKIMSNVTLLNCAASKKNEKLTLYVPDQLDLSSQAEMPNSTPVVVDGRTLDSISLLYGHPDLVKVDVEGFEVDVFLGMEGILKSEKLPIIVFESLNTVAFETSKTLLNKLSNGKYKFYRVSVNGEICNFSIENLSNDYVALPCWATDRAFV